MNIPAHLGVTVVFGDDIDLFGRSADGVPVTLRLSRAAAGSLGAALACVLEGQGSARFDNPAPLDHPETLPAEPSSSLAEPRAPP